MAAEKSSGGAFFVAIPILLRQKQSTFETPDFYFFVRLLLLCFPRFGFSLRESYLFHVRFLERFRARRSPCADGRRRDRAAECRAKRRKMLRLRLAHCARRPRRLFLRSEAAQKRGLLQNRRFEKTYTKRRRFQRPIAAEKRLFFDLILIFLCKLLLDFYFATAPCRRPKKTAVQMGKSVFSDQPAVHAEHLPGDEACAVGG
ncbi:MAG: hypothetical protein IJU56_00920 [Clostridia bacterium]|nr:hypothetical protein [Clostridia bacterium]